MKIKIKHKTTYCYGDDVFLEPHTLRFSVRPDKHVKVVSSSVKFTPKPAGANTLLETNGSISTMVWFNEKTYIFEVDVNTVLESEPFNPFEFLIHPSSCTTLPMVYPTPWEHLLLSYINKNEANPEIKAFAESIAKKAGNQTVEFLIQLSQFISQEFNYKKREEGAPHEPAKTLLDKSGSCRDLTVLAMNACGEMGLATRFVSGYFVAEGPDKESELHAWFEVYLPGAGWRGFDPTHGLACDHHYLALCASADPTMTLPISGTYRGLTPGQMTTKLSIEA